MGKFRIVIVLLVCWLSSFLAFDTLWKHPADVLVNTGGDAIKNYYTPIWYVLHDSAGHISGMHYPYGDNYVFADTQPALASALQWYHTHIHKLDGYDILAVLNLAMVIGVSLGIFFIYLLLRECNLPWLYALLVAVLISLFSPQIMRIGGHYGLSYVFAIPLVWLLCHYTLTRKHFVHWVLFLTVLLGTLQLLHVYYLLICGLFIAMYAAMGVITNGRQYKRYSVRGVALVLAVVVPYIVFQYWLGHTSHSPDRVAIPYGIEAYKANFKSVFFPSYMPYLSGTRADWEGQVYLGFLGLPMLIFLLYKFAGQIIRRKFFTILKPTLPTPLQLALWPAVFSLFFAIGVPLLWLLQMDLLPEGLRQFRSLGRFAWVFYYVFTVFSAFTLYQFYRHLSIKGSKKIAILLMFMALGYWGYEVQLYLWPQQKKMAQRYTERSAAQLFTNDSIYQGLINAGVQPNSFQAIIPLPFYHNGSEKLTAHGSGNIMYQSIKVSLQLGLPMVASNMARTPIISTASIVQLFSSPILARDYVNDLDADKKPFLICYNGGTLTTEQQAMLDRAQFLIKIADLSYYSLAVADIAPQQVDVVSEYETAKDSLLKVADMQVSQPGYYLVHTFDDKPEKQGMYQSGCLVSVNDTIWIAQGIEIPTTDDTLEVSFWVAITPEYHAMGEVFGTYASDSSLQNIYCQPTSFWDIDNMWMRVSITLYPTTSPAKLNLLLKGKYLTVDQLMIKPLHADAYSNTPYGDTMLYNNYFVYPLATTQKQNN